MIGGSDHAGPSGKGYGMLGDPAFTLNCVDRQGGALSQYGTENAGCLTARGDSSPCADRGQNIVCMTGTQAHCHISDEIAGCLTAHMGKDDAPVVAGGSISENAAHEAFGFAQNTRNEARIVGDPAFKPLVRRLTPLECERLQGFPDNHTRIMWKGKPAEECPDGPRYKAIGNSMAVPVMSWLGERIEEVDRLWSGGDEPTITDDERQLIAGRLRYRASIWQTAYDYGACPEPYSAGLMRVLRDEVTDALCIDKLSPPDRILERLAELAEPEPVTGETSDGYHTFDELYHHRAVLFSVIVAKFPDLSWKSRLHADGTMYDGMFIVGIDTPAGQATYHYDVEPYWNMFQCLELDRAPEWDGHTPDDAIGRIASLRGSVLRGHRKDCAIPRLVLSNEGITRTPHCGKRPSEHPAYLSLGEQNMTLAMISQPMAGKTDEEIVEDRERAVAALTAMGYEVVNTYFTDEWYSDAAMEKRGVVQVPLCYLAKSLENMSLCHAAYFVKGWEDARGCKIEHEAAEAYGLEVIHE